MLEYNLNINEKHQMYIQHNILFIIQQTYGATDSRQMTTLISCLSIGKTFYENIRYPTPRDTETQNLRRWEINYWNKASSPSNSICLFTCLFVYLAILHNQL